VPAAAWVNFVQLEVHRRKGRGGFSAHARMKVKVMIVMGVSNHRSAPERTQN